MFSKDFKRMIGRSLLKEELVFALFTMSQLNNDCVPSFLLSFQALLQSFVRFSVKACVSKVSNSQKRSADSDRVSRVFKFNLFEVTQLWYISDFPPMNTQPRMALITIGSLGFPFLIYWSICKVGMSAPIKTEMSLVLEKSRFMTLRCDHFSFTSALSILYNGKFKFSTIQTFSTFILPG